MDISDVVIAVINGSASTWTDKWQKCKKCDVMIYPYNQHPLVKKDEDEDDIIIPSNNTLKPHDTIRCEKVY